MGETQETHTNSYLRCPKRFDVDKAEREDGVMEGKGV